MPFNCYQPITKGITATWCFGRKDFLWYTSQGTKFWVDFFEDFGRVGAAHGEKLTFSCFFPMSV